MRKRIVGGKLTIITHGNHSIYATEGNITHNAAIKVAQHGQEEGVSYGNYEGPPPKETKANVVVHFRPTPQYKGEFGFDWLRNGDIGLRGDFWYRDIVGKYRDKKGQLYQIYNNEKDKPAVSFFNDELHEYENYMNRFNKLFFMDLKSKGNKDWMYIIPKMTIWKGEKAKLTLKLNVIEEPKSLRFSYDKSCFKLSGFTDDKISAKSKGKRALPLTIECLKYFNQNKTIEIYADDNLAGKLEIMQNNYAYQADVVVIPVITKVGQKVKVGRFSDIENNRLVNILKQCYIQSKIEFSVPLNLSSYWTSFWFKFKFTKDGQITDKLNKEFFNYLDDKFFENKYAHKYKDYYRIYIFNEEANGLYGQAEDIANGAKSVIAFASRSASGDTVAHELLHAIGLYHSFDNNSETTFKRKKTDNIMDYGHWDKIDRISTFHWQWDRLRKTLSHTKKILQ